MASFSPEEQFDLLKEKVLDAYKDSLDSLEYVTHPVTIYFICEEDGIP